MRDDVGNKPGRQGKKIGITFLPALLSETMCVVVSITSFQLCNRA